MSTRYAVDTEVSTDRSIAEIRGTIRRYGASEFAHMEGENRAVIMFTMRDRRVMFRLDMPDRDGEEFTHAVYGGRGRQRRTAQTAEAAWDQACRSRWRALALVVKAKLEAVESGIAEFETEFLGNIVMPGTSVTVGEYVGPELRVAYQRGEPRPLLPPPPKA